MTGRPDVRRLELAYLGRLAGLVISQNSRCFLSLVLLLIRSRLAAKALRLPFSCARRRLKRLNYAITLCPSLHPPEILFDFCPSLA